MKKNYQFVILFIALISITFVSAQNPIFYLHPNGVTCMCPDAEIGEIGVVNGVTYTKRTREQITPQNAATTCTSGITDMSFLFTNTTLNQSIDSWDVSNVTNMQWMFESSNFNQPIGNWDVSNVTNMTGMFVSSNFNQPIGNWDVSSVTTMRQMFYNTPFNQAIGNWNVSNVTNMSLMFADSSFNQSIENWDVSNVTNMEGLFSSSTFNQHIGNWDVSSVTNMQFMFGTTQFNQPIGNWDVSSVTNMRLMFENSGFNQPIGNWDVSSVTNMEMMFTFSTFNQPIGNWDVSNVNNMFRMFQYSNFNQPIGNWNVSNVINMGLMFEQTSFHQDISNWDVSNVTNMFAMFHFAINFNQPIVNWDVSNVTNMSLMFHGAHNFNHDISNWDVSSVTNMSGMFGFNSNFNHDISTWIFNPSVIFFNSGYPVAFISSNFSIENYDLLLQSFSNQNLTGKTFNVANLSYCNTTARNDLINNKGWTINGDTALLLNLIAPMSISVPTEPESCFATGLDLGQPIIVGCGTLTLTNDAPIEFPIGDTNVIWSLEDGNGSIVTANQTVTVNIQVDDFSVCYVTSDETDFTKNRIFINNLNWNNVEYYEVLRETSANVFDPIGIITQGQTSFLDVNSNNSTQTYRYRVRTLDICNNLSSSSPSHRTILLQSGVATNNSVNLSWNAYEGVTFGTYSIYRKVNEGDFEVIATLPSTNLSFNDTGANVLENNYQYYVAIEIPDCVNGFNNTQIRSNREIFDPNMSVGDPLLNNKLIIYPNPTSNHLYIEMSESIEFIKAEIFNTVGQKVMDVNESNFSVKNLPVATYFIKIYTTKGTAVKTFLKK